MSTARVPRHLSEGELVRYLDREAPPATRQRWSAHIDICELCSNALEGLRVESDRVSDWLARAYPGADAVADGLADPRPHDTSGRGGSLRTPERDVRAVPLPADRRRYVPWLKAAAAVVLVAAPVVALPPVRGWIVERVADGGASPTVAPAVETTVATPPAVDRESPRIRFVPAPGRFTVTLEGTVDRRSLLLERAVGEEAVFESDGAGPETVVSAQALRVQAAAPARLRLALPSSITEVVIVADGSRIVVSGSDLDAGRWVP